MANGRAKEKGTAQSRTEQDEQEDRSRESLFPHLKQLTSKRKPAAVRVGKSRWEGSTVSVMCDEKILFVLYIFYDDYKNQLD